MSRSVNTTLQNHLATGCTTLARILTITRKDGTVKRFTDHDRSLVVAGQTYIPQDGVRFASVYSSVGQGIQNTELDVIYHASGIVEVDVVRGLYDGATIKIELVNWADPSMGTIIVMVGTISIIGSDHKVGGKFDIRGLLHRGNRMFGEVYSPDCRADLGDARCTVDIDSLSQVITITEVTNSSVIVGTVPLTADAEFYALGVVTWLTGDNVGYSMEVLQDNVAGTTRTIYLSLPMPFDVQVGDTATLYPGCDKLIRTCCDKYNNAPNFRGEPPMTGEEFV